MANPFGWIEIPALDKNRAVVFYNSVFDWNISFQTYGSTQLAMFPAGLGEGATGSLIYDPKFCEPSPTLGPLVYFTCDDAGTAAEKAERAGGRILVPKQPAPESGFQSVVLDTEGNRIGFHSKK